MHQEAKLGLRQLKEACPGTQRMRVDMSYQPPNDVEKQAEDLGTSTS